MVEVNQQIPSWDEAPLRPAAQGGEPSAASRVFDERPASRGALDLAPARRGGGVWKKLLTTPTTSYTVSRSPFNAELPPLRIC